MHYFSIWNLADKPNYSTNVDLAYPYSEMPHQGKLDYLKIPVAPTNMIKHVDYWGEGRIVSGEGIHGFPNSYNVNHQYRLVSCGPDKDRKIPNRIPLVSYTDSNIDCDTSAFITNKSVLVVTISGARMHKNCISDIVRMVNDERGKVVVYGTYDSGEMSELTDQLKKKGLFRYENATLDSELLGLTYFDSYVAFITVKNEKDKEVLKKDLIDYLDKGDYDMAAYVSEHIKEFVSEAVTKVIRSKPEQVMPYAYKLWIAGEAGQDIVRNHFPEPYQYILNKSGESFLTIKNKEYGLFVTVGYNSDPFTKEVFGRAIISRTKNPSAAVKFYPKYEKGKVTFVIISGRKHAIEVVDDKDKGDSHCVAVLITRPDKITDDHSMFLLEPSIGDDGKVLFRIIHSRNKQQQLIKMDAIEKEFSADKIKGREVWGHNGKIDKINDNFLWDIGPNDPVKLSVPLQSVEVLSDTD